MDSMKISNSELVDCATVLSLVNSRKNRNVVVVFRLAKIHKTISPIVEAYQEVRRAISLQFAQLDEHGEVKYIRNDEGMESGEFTMNPRTMHEYRDAVHALDREINVIHGLKQLSVQQLLDGWKNLDDDGKAIDNGVEPAIIVGLAPFLDMDVDTLDSPLAASVENIERTAIEDVNRG